MLYFAYGSNMDRLAMRRRCPRSRALGRARLMRHRLIIINPGYVSIKGDPRGEVHGVLYDLALADVPSLDRYEEVVGRGLYRKITQPVLREAGGPVRALIYVGGSQVEAKPFSAHLETIIAAAKDWSLPEAYVAYLASLGQDRREARRRRAIQGAEI